ncbi:hypothetical protein N2152v2_003001 [Parachlorella kessleri]
MAAAARVQPRKPTWLSPDLGWAPQVQTDNTARVLEFASAPRPQPRDSSASAYQQGLQPSQAGLPARVLSPEPAYASVLGRLTELSQGAHSPSAERDAEASRLLPSDTAREQLANVPLVTNSHDLEQPLQPNSRQGQLEAGQSAMLQPPTLPPSPAAALQRKPLPDLGLQLQLKQRIEQAKAEIKQQLSPLFRVSQALLTGEDPAAAADTLDQVATAECAGQGSAFPLLPGPTLSSLPGSPAAPRRLAVAGAAADDGSLVDGRTAGNSWQISSGLASLSFAGDSHSAVRDNPLYEGQPVEAARGSPVAADDVDSLVLSARAAVSKAHATIADLASPPHPPRGTAPRAAAAREAPGKAEPAQAVQGSGATTEDGALREPYRQSSIPAGTNSSIGKSEQRPDHSSEEGFQPTRQQQAWPCAEQSQQHEPRALAEGAPVAAHSQALVPAHSLAAAPDLEGRIVQLRQRSEDVIRGECDKLIARMHAMFDEFLLSVQQHGLLVRVSVGPGGAAGVATPSMDNNSPTTWGGAAEPRMAWPVPTAPRPPQQPKEQEHRQQRPQHQPGAQKLEGVALPNHAERAQQPSTAATQDHLPAGEGSCCSSDAGSGELVQQDSSENVAPNALDAPAAAAAPSGFEFPRQQGGSPIESHEAGSLWLPAQGRHQPWESSTLADDGLGFGSPIRPTAGSQRPSPAKPRSILGNMAERPHQANSVSSQVQPPLLSATGARQPAAGSAATAVSGRGLLGGYLSAPGASPSYLTARSSLGLASSPSPGPGDSRQATSRLQLPLGNSNTAGGIGSRSVTPSAQQAGVPPRSDLDSIVKSIRRLAAETK